MVKKFIEILQAKYPQDTEEMTQDQQTDLAAYGKGLEQCVFDNFREYKAYCDRARTLIFNLRDPKSSSLRDKVKSMEIPPAMLATIDTKELANEDLKKQREQVQQQNMQARRTDYLLE